MAKSSSENEPCCSKDCKKNNDSLNRKIKDLTSELSEANNYIYHYRLAVDQLEGTLVEYKEREVKYIEKIRTLEMYRASNLKSIKTLGKELETLKEEKDVVDGKLARLLKSSKDLESLIESQRPSPTIESTSEDGQNRNSSASENGEPTDSILSKHATQQLGPDFVLKKKACFNCDDFSHLAYDCRKRVKRGTTGSQNNAYMRPPHRPVGHRPHGAPIRPPHRLHCPPMKPMRPNMNGARPNGTTFNKQAHSYANRSFQRTSAVRPQYRAPWVPTVNKNFPPVNKLPTGQLRDIIGRCSEDKKKQRNKKLEDSEAEHQV
nr:hypothetical protein [Tanacetum cinerariifolium]